MNSKPSKILWKNYWLWEKICESLKTSNSFKDECTTNKNGVETYYRLFLIFSQKYREFCWFAKPLTDLRVKQVPAKIFWGPTQEQAFQELKRRLCQATTNPLYVVDFTKPFNLFVDTSASSTSAILI